MERVRVLKAIKHYNLPLTRWAFSGGEPLSPFLDAFDIDLFLSKDEKEVQRCRRSDRGDLRADQELGIN